MTCQYGKMLHPNNVHNVTGLCINMLYVTVTAYDCLQSFYCPCKLLLFQEHTGLTLPYKELGFESPENMFLSLADSILQFTVTKKGNLMTSNAVDFHHPSNRIMSI